MKTEKHQKLTPKQELFCQEYIKTGNQSEAYRIAYPKSLNWKEEAVNVQASILMKNSKVVVRLKELQTKQEEKHDITKDKIVIRLKQIIFEQYELGVDKIDLNAMNKAIDTVNKMLGYNAAEKLEHSGSIDVNGLADRLIGK